MKLMFFSLIVLLISIFILAGCAVQPEKKMVLCAPSEMMRFTSTGHVIDCRTQKIHWM